jgi:hypothetical protein
MSAETGKHHGNKYPRLEEVTVSEERENTWENLMENRQTGDHKADSRIFYWDTKKIRDWTL